MSGNDLFGKPQKSKPATPSPLGHYKDTEADAPMVWVERMNNIRAVAAEIVNAEIVFL